MVLLEIYQIWINNKLMNIIVQYNLFQIEIYIKEHYINLHIDMVIKPTDVFINIRWWWSWMAREAASFTKYLKRKTTWLWTPEKMAHRSEVFLFKLIGLSERLGQRRLGTLGECTSPRQFSSSAVNIRYS
jgi:hypothetical protein